MATQKDKVKRNFNVEMADAGRKLGAMFKNQTMGAISLSYGTVEKVDEPGKTVDVIMDNGRAIRGITLDIVQGGNSGVLIIPSVDSAVVVGLIENRPELPFIISFTTIDKIVLKIEQTVINLTSDLIEINGGGNNGMVLIDPLTSALNSLVSSFNSHTHTNGNMGSPTGPPVATAQQFNKSNYENKKIKQ